MPPTAPSVGPYERVLWANASMTLGSFDASADREDFETAGQVGSRPAIAFSRSAVGIAHARREPVVSDGTVAVLHNPGWPFRRFRVDERGDHCEWLSVDPEALLSINPRLGRDARRPFDSSTAPLPRRAAALVRLAARHLRDARPPDALWVAETLIEVLTLLAPEAPSPRSRSSARHARIVRRVRELLSARPHEDWTVEAIARETGSSPFHACRIFRRRTGHTLHGYLTEQRLRAALTRLASGEGERDLVALARALGFATHSQFTMHFRRAFGVTPSRFRRRATSETVRDLARRLRAADPSC
jgi:AraC-like DNA-binding protein